MVAACNAREEFRRVDTPPAVPLLLVDGIEVTEQSIWVWLQIPDFPTFLLEDETLSDATMSAAAALNSLLPPGVDYHLKSLRAPHTGDAYRNSWDTVQSVRAPRTADYIELGAHRIDLGASVGALRRRVTLLGVRWPEIIVTATPVGAGASWWSRWNPAPPSRKVRQAAAEDRLHHAAPGIRRWLDAAARSALAGVPAPAGLIGWAYARELRRTDLPIPDGSVLTPERLVHLAHGRVDSTRSPEHLVVTDLETGIQQWVCVLVPAAISGFRSRDLTLPGGEWLQILGDVDGVEASVRGVNHGQLGARQLLEKALKVARSQIRESEITEAPPPPAAVEAEETLEERLAEGQRRVDVMTTTHARWVVHADTEAQLSDRVAELRQRYDGIVDLQQVADVQDLLWRELLPGDQVRVPEFGADQPMRTLAGSWFSGGSPFGDSTGPYLGVNLGTSADPVQLHLASRSDADKKMPTTVVFTGLSGSGKSTSLELFTLGLLAEGAWVLLPDVKGDLGGIVATARDVLGVAVQKVNAVDPGCAGMMDPMRFAPTADDARTLTLDALMGALSGDDRRVGEAILESAVDTILRTPRDAWSTPAVIDHLATLPTTDPNQEVGRRLGRLLQVRATSPQLRAVTGTLPAGQSPLITGRGLIYLRLAGLDFPHHTPQPEQWTVPQRCSMATLRVALAFALHQSRRVRELKKAVALPELHLLTGFPDGAQFVDWLCRVGRALQTYLLLDSQSAVDLSRMTALLEQILMAFCFRATSDTEQRAQGTLLGRPDPGPELRAALRGLGTGECVAMDRHRRLTVMQFDRLTTGIARTLATDAGEDTTTDNHTEETHLDNPTPDGGTAGEVAGQPTAPNHQPDPHTKNGSATSSKVGR